MSPKTERETVKGILDQFDRKIVEELLKAYPTKTPSAALKHRSDFPPPGPEVGADTIPRGVMESRSIIERIIGDSNFLPAAFLEEGVLRQKAVARLPKVSSSNPLGDPWGSGFLVANSLLMTNNHVIGSVAEAKTIMAQFNYQIDLNGVAQPIDTWSLDPDNFFYTDAALDFTLVRVKAKGIIWPLSPTVVSPSGGEAAMLEVMSMIGAAAEAGPTIPIGPPLFASRYPGWKWGHLQLPKSAITYSSGQLLNVIQHPAGRMKEVALQENEVTHIYSNRIHYTTDTEGGSSGSPVLNNAWDLVALHHAAGDWDAVNNRWIDNEGMRIDSIVQHLRTQFALSRPSLLTELGI